MSKYLREGSKFIKEGDDFLDSNLIECKYKHQFELSEYDLKKGEWCKECDNILCQIFLEENLNYTIDEDLNIYYNNYLIFIENDNLTRIKKIREKKNKYNIICMVDININNKEIMKDKLFKAIKKKFRIIIIFEDTDIEKFTNDLEEEYETEVIEDYTFSVEKISTKGEGSLVKRNLNLVRENKFLVYARVSTVKQAKDGMSLDSQQYGAFKKTKDISTIYIDKGISGKDIKGRPAFKLMLNEIKSGDTLIVYSLTRLGRNQIEILNTIKDFEKKGINIITLDNKYDNTTAQGKLMNHMMLILAEYERELTSERIQDNISYKKEKGLFVPKARLGYKINPNRLKDNKMYLEIPEEIEIINQIIELRKKNYEMGQREFTRLVNCKKIKTLRKSKTWHREMIKNILEYKGYYFRNK